MKYFFLSIFITIGLILQAQEKPEPISLSDVSYPILSIKKSPSQSSLFFTLAGGRFLLFDLSNGKLKADALPVWKNFNINGFELGGDAEFSNNGKYILVSEQNTMYAREKLKVKPFKICVLDAANGKVIFESEGVNSACMLSDNTTLLLANDEGIYTTNFLTSAKGQLFPIENCEVACLNHKGDILSVSYDPKRDEFKEADGAGLNKKEVKLAAKFKKLIAFYSYPSMKKLGVLPEEIDVVFSMQYTPDDAYLMLFTRTGQPEHVQVNILNGMDKANDLNQFQRIDMSTLKVDNINFIYQTSEQLANSDYDMPASLFVYGDNKGFFAGKREVVVADFNKPNSYFGKYTYEGRARTRNLYSTAFAILDESNILVANGLKVAHWDFKKLPNFTEYIEPTNENALLDKAITQLETDLQSAESSLSKSLTKKNISGLYLLTITIQKGGEVVSVFTQSDDKTNINMQNMLKDIILKYKFNVDVPKNERIKFTYTFNL